MRKLGWLGLGALLLAVAAPAQDFTRTMTPEEQAAAGLARLTPAELAALKAAVERYKSGAVEVVTREAGAQTAAAAARAAEAERQAAAAEARASEAAAQAAKAAKAEPRKGPGWLTALITLEKTAQAPDSAEEVRARLAGPLESFSGRQRFTLDNGQVWQMTDLAEWAGPTYDRPEVTIRPGVLGTFWLRIPAAGVRVKVRPVKLE
jgi:hypothetical protein